MTEAGRAQEILRDCAGDEHDMPVQYNRIVDAITDALTSARTEAYAAGAAETERKIVALLVARRDAAKALGRPAAADALTDVIEYIERGDYGRTTPAEEWRDISTAPKDGKPFLAWSAEQRIVVMAKWYGANPEAPWIYHPGDNGMDYDPTHWQPLPTPPKEPADG